MHSLSSNSMRQRTFLRGGSLFRKRLGGSPNRISSQLEATISDHALDGPGFGWILSPSSTSRTMCGTTPPSATEPLVVGWLCTSEPHCVPTLEAPKCVDGKEKSDPLRAKMWMRQPRRAPPSCLLLQEELSGLHNARIVTAPPGVALCCMFMPDLAAPSAAPYI